MHFYNEELINSLKKSLQDEEGAIGSYYQLAQKAPSQEFKRVILGIRKDEMGHALKTRKFLSYLTGMMYSGDVNFKEGEIKDFKNGIKDAIKDEEEAAPFYKKIMDMAKCYPEVYFGIAETRKDEQTHAMLLKSILE